MNIELKEITMKVDALIDVVDTLVNQIDVRHTGVLGTFHSALNDVERMKFHALTTGGKEPTPQIDDVELEQDTIRIKEVEEFLRRCGKIVLNAQVEQGLKIRPNGKHFNRYVIYLWTFDVRQPSHTQNPRLTLEFDFDYHRPASEWQLIENVRLVATGRENGHPTAGITTRVIPDKLIQRETWTRIVRHALNALECHEVIDELETYFPKETPHEYA